MGKYMQITLALLTQKKLIWYATIFFENHDIIKWMQEELELRMANFK